MKETGQRIEAGTQVALTLDIAAEAEVDRISDIRVRSPRQRHGPPAPRRAWSRGCAARNAALVHQYLGEALGEGFHQLEMRFRRIPAPARTTRHSPAPGRDHRPQRPDGCPSPGSGPGAGTDGCRAPSRTQPMTVSTSKPSIKTLSTSLPAPSGMPRQACAALLESRTSSSSVESMVWLLAILAYLLGSLSFAVLLSRWFGTQDPRASGSGNPGATNMLRVAGKKLCHPDPARRRRQRPAAGAGRPLAGARRDGGGLGRHRRRDRPPVPAVLQLPRRQRVSPPPRACSSASIRRPYCWPRRPGC